MDKFFTQIKVNAESEIKRVLNVNVKSNILTKECSSEMVSVTGKTNINMIYVSNDGTIEHADGTADFIEKQQTAYFLDDLFATDECQIQNVNFSGTEAIFSIEHSVTVFGTYSYSLGEDFNDDDLVTHKKSFSTLKLTKSAEDNFVVAEEMDTNLGSISVLSSNASVIALDVSASVDKIVVEGKILAGVTYSGSESVGFYQKEFEFKQEIEASGVNPNMTARADLEVKGITVTPEEKQEKTNLVFAIDVYAKVYAYEETTYDVITDIFSLKNILSTTTDYVESKNYAETKIEFENVLSATDVSDIENLDDILGVFDPYYHVTSVEENETSVIVKGKIVAYALYRANNDIFKLQISELTSTEIQKDKNLKISSAFGNVEVGAFKVKAGKELETNFKVQICAEFDTVVAEKYVKSFEVKEERAVSNGGVTVYVAGGGDTLFDVAKAVGVRPEEIAKQNNFSEVFEQGEKIYIYSPINLI